MRLFRRFDSSWSASIASLGTMCGEIKLSRCNIPDLFEAYLFMVLHMGPEHASREKKLSMVNFLIFVQKNVSTIRFQEIKIRPLKGFEKMRFLCFYIIGV